MPVKPPAERHALSVSAQQLLWTLVGILLVYGIFFLGTVSRNMLQKFSTIGEPEPTVRTISLDAIGTAQIPPSSAKISLGATTEAETVDAAQQKNTGIMNALIAEMKALGIADADIQTRDYSVFPLYEYPADGQRKIYGYQVSQRVQVWIRDVSMSDKIIAAAGKVGATDIGGLEFVVDEQQEALDEARADAAKQLANKLTHLKELYGANIGDMMNYSEYIDQSPVDMYGYRAEYGGGGAPMIPGGENTITLRVNAMFELEQ